MTKMNNLEKADIDKWALKLKEYLSGEGDPRALDDDFINARAESAGNEFEFQRSHGMTVDQAEECSYQVLFKDLQ
jgi:hypothetical protein